MKQVSIAVVAFRMLLALVVVYILAHAYALFCFCAFFFFFRFLRDQGRQPSIRLLDLFDVGWGRRTEPRARLRRVFECSKGGTVSPPELRCADCGVECHRRRECSGLSRGAQAAGR